MKRFALAVVVAAVAAVAFASSASALAFDDAKPCHDTQPLFICPAGLVDTDYSLQFESRGGCGPDPLIPGSGLPYQYRILNGSLPAGMSLSKSGVVSGRPNAAGTSRFWVELSDENPPSQSWCVPQTAEREFSITVLPGLRVVQTSPAPGTVGTPYSVPITASLVYAPDSTQPVTSPLAWSVSAGTLPPGLAVGPTDGVLSGTPTTAGSYTFTVQAVLDAQRSGQATYTLEIREPVVITPLPLHWEGAHGSEVGVPLPPTAKLTATGGTSTFTWSVTAGSLPDGVVLGPDGTIAGKPTVGGRFPFTAQVADTEGRTATLNTTLVVAARLGVRTVALRPAKVGRLYTAKLATLGGALPVKWKILRGTLPRGVHFAKKLGTFVGTPRKEGKYRITVQVVDALGIKAQTTLFLTVNA